MKKTAIAGILLGLSLILAACVQELDRSGDGTSTGELLLDVRGPADGSQLRTDAVVVHGRTSPGARVAINGSNALVDSDGSFRGEIALTPGPVRISVVASDSDGNTQQKDLTVTYVELPPQPFFLVVTEPEDQSIIPRISTSLSGQTSADAIVSINGVSVDVSEDGMFSTDVTLEEGPNIIDVLATNTDGEILSTIVAVIARP